jgi:hypothetical protein
MVLVVVVVVVVVVVAVVTILKRGRTSNTLPLPGDRAEKIIIFDGCNDCFLLSL